MSNKQKININIGAHFHTFLPGNTINSGHNSTSLIRGWHNTTLSNVTQLSQR